MSGLISEIFIKLCMALVLIVNTNPFKYFITKFRKIGRVYAHRWCFTPICQGMSVPISNGTPIKLKLNLNTIYRVIFILTSGVTV